MYFKCKCKASLDSTTSLICFTEGKILEILERLFDFLLKFITESSNNTLIIYLQLKSTKQGTVRSIPLNTITVLKGKKKMDGVRKGLIVRAEVSYVGG